MKSQKILISTLALAFGTAMASADLITNGSFETGDFTGWTLNADDSVNFVLDGFSSDGDYAAWFGEFQPGGTLSQTIATETGATYLFGFDFAGDGDDPSAFSASFGSETVLDLVNPAFDMDYVHYEYSLVATGTSTDVSFFFYDEPWFINLDNVTVVKTADAVPEPASMAVLGMGALAMLRRRRKA